MKILFVCKHNRFRSKVAEGVFNKLNKNKENYAESAGMILDDSRPYIEENVVNIMKEKSHDVSGIPKQINKSLAKNFDKIVIVADNVDKRFFNDFKGEVKIWKISDCGASDVKGIKKRVDEIEREVKFLLETL